MKPHDHASAFSATRNFGRLTTGTVYLAAAWSGFFVMGVELLGGRLLAPFFGSSVFVWGGIITVFMTCLSLGYLLGGQLSLVKPTIAILGGLLIAEALMATPIVALGSIAWEWLSYRMPDPRYGSLIGSLMMFGIPTIIAGMVSPYAVRLLIGNVHSSGKAAGRLYFVSTFGSAAGTIMTAFYLVAWLPINTIILIFIGITLVVGVLALAAGLVKVPNHANPLLLSDDDAVYLRHAIDRRHMRAGARGPASPEAAVTLANANVRFACKGHGEDLGHAQNR